MPEAVRPPAPAPRAFVNACPSGTLKHVLRTTLSRDATAAHVHVLIEQRYARLVRVGSRFWSASGVDVNLSLFKGVEINIESLRSLVAGGIAFATPEAPDSPVPKEGTKIPLPPGD